MFTLLAATFLSVLVSHSPALAVEQSQPDAVMVADKGDKAATKAGDTPAAAKAERCEGGCNMVVGCGCSNATKASETGQAHAQEGSAASGESKAKAAGGCGCMKGKTNP